MTRLKRFLPYLILPVIAYWTAGIYVLLTRLGLLVYDDLAYKMWAIGGLLLYNPLAVMLVSFIYGLRHGFSWLLPLLIGLLFLPNILYTEFFTNSSGMAVYLPIYSCLSLLALAIGWLFRTLIQKIRKNS